MHFSQVGRRISRLVGFDVFQHENQSTEESAESIQTVTSLDDVNELCDFHDQKKQELNQEKPLCCQKKKTQ